MTEEETKAMQEAIVTEMTKQLAAVQAKLEEISGSVSEREKKTADELERIESELKEGLESLSSKGTGKAAGVVDGETGDPKCGFLNMGDMMKDVIVTAETNVMTERLVRYKKMEEEHLAKARDAGTGFEVDDVERGGYTLPEEFRTQVWERAIEISNVMSKVFIMPLTSKSIKIPAMGGYDRSGGSLYGGIEFYDEGENHQIQDVRPGFEQINYDLGMQAAMTHMSDSMMRFSPLTLDSFIREKFGEALAWRIEYLLLNGDGAGQPDGIIGHGSTVVQAKETDQVDATVIFENIANMDSRIWRENNAEWYFNRQVKPQLRYMSMAVGTGGNVLNWKEELDHPYFTNEHCQALGTVGDIVLADWTQYGVALPQGQNQQPTFDTSIHFKFDYAQTSFRFIFYMDGHPLWRTTETPRHGDSETTLGPAVTLATRSS